MQNLIPLKSEVFYLKYVYKITNNLKLKFIILMEIYIHRKMEKVKSILIPNL